MVTLWRYFTAKIQVKKRATGKGWKIKKNLAECLGFSAVAVQFNVLNHRLALDLPDWWGER